MWNDILDNNTFIKNLYKQVPELLDVRIAEIKLLDEGDKVTIVLDLPKYAENPPKKWNGLGYNTVVVEIDFFDIKEVYINSLKRGFKGNVEITLNPDKTISVIITGSVEARITAEAGLIQAVRGYCNKI
ncbi:Imm50 family immunity protein [Clostridium estertheticum]|uniref:Immunity protein 50 n=1 Tax=Clostridium estertheticum TaxID=238834 RepID=A0A5N7IV57_9CLOT|nr:Imm50 family immunity protein [Clostridium estertheticum]MCB2343327.1 immunity 50 family protein [Clostridium estertheticum]MPQ34171.1 hypothetical protein [Clostridium estertheticum]MPQ64903.1 hypothetical protein [Clostridium estertheticum]